MQIGIISKEYFGLKDMSKNVPMNIHGGFGYVTRKKAEKLVKMGHDVHVFVPRFAYDGNNEENLELEENGVNIHFFKTLYNGLSRNTLSEMVRRGMFVFGLDKGYKKVLEDYPADIYLSEDPSERSARIVKEGHPHIGIFQDPFDDIDILILKQAGEDYLNSDYANPQFVTEHSLRTENFKRVGLYYTSGRNSNFRTGRYTRAENSHSVFVPANFISDKMRSIFSMDFSPGTLLNPIDVDSTIPEKSSSPTIVWLARWDPQKRADVALRVAKEMPEVDFYFIGAASGLPILENRQKFLSKAYEKYRHIHILNFISEEEKQRILAKSWIHLNTSVREGLPSSFLEAGARGCAIVSSVNPDNYSSKFGSFVENGEFSKNLRNLIKSEECFEKGKLAHQHMLKFHQTSKVMREHIDAMNRLLDER